MSINRTAKTWGAEELTSTDLNAEVKDLWTGLQAAWTSYGTGASWTASTSNPSLGNGTWAGAYLQIGKTILVRVNITMGSTTTYGSGQYRIALPVTAGSAAVQLLDAEALIASAAYTAKGRITSAAPSYVALYCSPTTAGGSDRFVTATAPATFASGSILTAYGMYEAA